MTGAPDDADVAAGIAAVAADLDAAVEVVAPPPDPTDPSPDPVAPEASTGPAEDPPEAKKLVDQPDARDPESPWLPEDCAIQALGVTDHAAWYLDANRMLKPLPFGKHGRLELMGLFGKRQDQLYRHWPTFKARYDGTGRNRHLVGYDVSGWASEQVQEDLIHDCGLLGPWNPTGAVRGTGAWLSPEDELILHCGRELVIGPRLHAPGVIGDLRHGGFVYPAGADLPTPPLEPCVDDADIQAADELLALIGTWNLARKKTDARLLLGAVCAGFLGGAIKWRPVTWTTGGRNTGKSTFHELMKRVMGGWLIALSDSTPAGIWQHLGYSSRMIAFDELEPGDSPARVREIIKLARLMASGAMMLRGGQDHEGVNFTLRSCALFSSIDVPAMKPADLSRMAIVEFQRLSKFEEPDLNPERMAEIGRRLLRRLRTEFRRWPETLHSYRHALFQAGHDGRGCDVFGTLLAAGDLALSVERVDAAELARWQHELAPERLIEREGADDEDRACLEHILTSTADMHRDGIRRSVGTLIADLAHGWTPGTTLVETSHEALQSIGLRLIEEDGALFLCVANSHQGLARMMADTPWQAVSGGEGGWKRALRRLSRATPDNQRIGGLRLRATRLPIETVLREADG